MLITHLYLDYLRHLEIVDISRGPTTCRVRVKGWGTMSRQLRVAEKFKLPREMPTIA